MTEPGKRTHPLASLGGLVCAAGGWTFSQYCGVFIWIPGITAILLMLLFTRTPLRPASFAGAIAATGAHLIWFVVSGTMLGVWAPLVFDIILLFLGIIWLWAWPGLAGTIFLGIVQAASLAVNLVALSAASFGSVAHRALTAHCLFRSIALICLVYGYNRFRKERSRAVPGGVAAPVP